VSDKNRALKKRFYMNNVESLPRSLTWNPAMAPAGRFRKYVFVGLTASGRVLGWYVGRMVYNTAHALRWLADKVYAAHNWAWNPEVRRPDTVVDVRTMIDALRRFRDAYQAPGPGHGWDQE
jgi:hypothetical protein